MTSTHNDSIEAEEVDVSEHPETLIGRMILDPYGREWEVIETDTKDGTPTVSGELYWCCAYEATVIDTSD